jgi:hypothetical protein
MYSDWTITFFLTPETTLLCGLADTIRQGAGSGPQSDGSTLVVGRVLYSIYFSVCELAVFLVLIFSLQIMFSYLPIHNQRLKTKKMGYAMQHCFATFY